MKNIKTFEEFINENYPVNEYSNTKGQLDGAGYKDKETAERTVKMLDDVIKKDHSKAMSMATSWELKANEHPNKTPEMADAAKVYRAWINKNKKS